MEHGWQVQSIYIIYIPESYKYLGTTTIALDSIGFERLHLQERVFKNYIQSL